VSKYDKIDALILATISDRPKGFSEIFVSTLQDECKRIAAEQPKRSPFEPVPYRILDRRLQALRKAGSIKFTGKGWVRSDPYGA
jgi:hypothetical protein